MCQLSILYTDLDWSDTKGLFWLQKAASLGSEKAQEHLKMIQEFYSSLNEAENIDEYSEKEDLEPSKVGDNKINEFSPSDQNRSLTKRSIQQNLVMENETSIQGTNVENEDDVVFKKVKKSIFNIK